MSPPHPYFVWELTYCFTAVGVCISITPNTKRPLLKFLAHLWGVYAMPMALSGVRCLSSVVRCVSSVSTITTRNNKVIKSIFGAIVHHVPGLCLLAIGGAPTLVIKLWLKNQIFTFLTSLKPPAGGASYYAGRFPRLRHYNLLKL